MSYQRVTYDAARRGEAEETLREIEEMISSGRNPDAEKIWNNVLTCDEGRLEELCDQKSLEQLKPRAELTTKQIVEAIHLKRWKLFKEREEEEKAGK